MIADEHDLLRTEDDRDQALRLCRLCRAESQRESQKESEREGERVRERESERDSKRERVRESQREGGRDLCRLVDDNLAEAKVCQAWVASTDACAGDHIRSLQKLALRRAEQAAVALLVTRAELPRGVF
eukprot:COSAG03_NODE_14187_length_473_cov_1.104278_1_plen_128_part_10